MDFRNYIPPDGWVWHLEEVRASNDNYLNSKHKPLWRRVNYQCKFSDSVQDQISRGSSA